MMFAGLIASLRLVDKLSTLFFTQVGPLSSFQFLHLILQQSCLILATMIVTASSVRNLQAKSGLPLLNRIVGWTVLGTLLFLNTAKRMTDATLISCLECSSVFLSLQRPQ
jgi:phosphatidylinositol glycan class N